MNENTILKLSPFKIKINKLKSSNLFTFILQIVFNLYCACPNMREAHVAQETQNIWIAVLEKGRGNF